MQYVGRLVSSVYNTIPAMNINPATLSGAIDIIVVERQVEIEVESDADEDEDNQRAERPPTPPDDPPAEEEEEQGPPPGWPRGLVWHPPPPPPPGPLSPPAFEVPDLTLSPPLRPVSPESPFLASALDLDKEKPRRKKPQSKKKTKMATELCSTPFHVRFGKMSVLRPAERRVTLHLNNHPEPLPFVMKVGNEGEAFFVFETDADDPSIPPEMVTSPVLSAASSPLLPPVQNDDITFVPPAEGEYEEEDTPRHSRSASLDDLDLGEAQGPAFELDPLDAQLEEFVKTTSHRHKSKKQRDRFNRITSEHGEPYTFDMDGYKLTADGENMAAEEGRRLAAEMHFKPNSRHARARMHRSHSKDREHAVEAESSEGATSEEDEEELDQPFAQDFVSDLIQCARHLRHVGHQDDEMQPDGELSHAPEDELTLRLVYRGRVHDFQLSLAGAEGVPPPDGAEDEIQEAREAFAAHQVSYDAFVRDASIVSDERLVVEYNGRYLLWEDRSALLAALSLYRRSLQSVDKPSPRLRATTEPPLSPPSKPSRWSRWWSRTSEAPASESVTSDEGRMERAKSEPPLERYERPASPSDSGGEDEPSKVYLKTLRLTSDQLKMMNLRKGLNTITFSVTSSFSGVAVVRARIFLWDASQPIVVSDIDGTITKSDALGHMFTLIGRDWTHQGVAKLFTDITSNGYRIMYLTSRAIGQADTTRDYLRGIKQDGYVLPEGPVIMSPDRLIASLHREVILRKPEVFKMAALRDIARLFGNEAHTSQDAEEEEETLPGMSSPGENTRRSRSPSPSPASPTSPPLDPLSSPLLTPRPGSKGTTESANPTPFYAGFGNRITDALSYRSVDIPSSRIFTIDPNGAVKMELLEMAGYNTSYIHMTDLVDQMFPIVKSGKKDTRAQRQFNDFNYWRAPLPEVHLPEIEPASPALSATGSIRSSRSMRSEPVSPPGQGKENRSRFSLLGRIASSSVSTLPTPQELERSTPELGSSPSSSSLWTAPWRRRAASPHAGPGASTPGQREQRATSPLVAPALTAEPEEEDVSDLEEDVMRQPGGHRRMLSQESRPTHASSIQSGEQEREEGSQADGDEPDEGEGDENEEENEGEILSEEEAGSEEDEDPLLRQGEIRFEWHG